MMIRGVEISMRVVILFGILEVVFLFALAIWYARRAWRMRFVDAASGETTTASSAAPAATDPT